jgi:UDP-3-O-[3-hydroxymyristoyl] N-acetylglucosamine deacetylase
MGKSTLKDEIRLEGVGLHTGEGIELRILPRHRGEGIVFLRTDSPKKVEIPANPWEVTATSFATIIGNNGTRISTVEHLMAALFCMELSNAVVEVQGPEVPIMDGSSLDFAKAIKEVGLEETGLPERYMAIKRPFKVEEQDKYIIARPYPGLKVRYVIEFPHPLIGRQEKELDIDPDTFLNTISPARTFGFLKDVKDLRSKGLARGGSLKNAIVLDSNGVLNPDGLRFKDEFVRHKILDFLGDLALLGRPVKGEFEVKKSGHTLNQRFIRELLSHKEAWELL